MVESGQQKELFGSSVEGPRAPAGQDRTLIAVLDVQGTLIGNPTLTEQAVDAVLLQAIHDGWQLAVWSSDDVPTALRKRPWWPAVTYEGSKQGIGPVQLVAALMGAQKSKAATVVFIDDQTELLRVWARMFQQAQGLFVDAQFKVTGHWIPSWNMDRFFERQRNGQAGGSGSADQARG